MCLSQISSQFFCIFRSFSFNFSNYGVFLWVGVWCILSLALCWFFVSGFLLAERVYHNHHSYWHYMGNTKFLMACGMYEGLDVQIWVSWSESISSTHFLWITLESHLFHHLLILPISCISMVHTSRGRGNGSAKSQMISFPFVAERSED